MNTDKNGNGVGSGTIVKEMVGKQIPNPDSIGTSQTSAAGDEENEPGHGFTDFRSPIRNRDWLRFVTD